MIHTNNRGLTLTELLIYMVLSGIVIAYGASMITHSSKVYVRQREVSKLQSGGRNTMAILARDIMNTGFKTYLDTNGVVRTLGGTWTGASIDASKPSDSAASFLFSAGENSFYDTLEIFKAEMVKGDSLEGVYRVKYLVDNNEVLLRISGLYDSSSASWGGWDTLQIATQIEALQYQFSIDGIDWLDDPIGVRDQIKTITVSFLSKTDREVAKFVDDTFNLGDISISLTDSSGLNLRRLYQETVEVMNNGVLY